MKRRILWISTFLPLFLSLVARAASAVEPARVRVIPSTIEMGTFYGGTKLHVAGIAGAGSKMIVVVRGPSTTEVFNKVGRVGPIWVNTGKVSISGVPTLLLIISSEPINTFLNAAAIDHYQLDVGSLKKHMQIETKAPNRDRVANDFLAFKARRGTYQITSHSVQLGALNHGKLSYSFDFEMPRSAAPGKYRATVLECRNGDVASQSDVDLVLMEVGLPALVARLAKEHASLYGIMSIIIAMVAGFGIDFVAASIFRRQAAAH